MTNNMRMISCSSMRAEYDTLHIATPALDPKVMAELSVRIAFLKPEQKTDLNLAAFYSLTGQTDIVSAVLAIDHPMVNLFTPRGEPRNRGVVEYVRNHLEKQRVAQEILRLQSYRV